jgi:hypothetical protein
MNPSRHFQYLNRASVRYGALVIAVPVALVVTALFGVPVSRPTPAAEGATMWLASANGTLVRANALVDRPAAQIVESMPYDAARDGVRLLPVAGGLVAVAPDRRLSRVNTRTREIVKRGTAPSATVLTDGVWLYSVGDGTVTVLDPDSLAPVGTHPVRGITGWTAGPDGLYVSTSAGAVMRVKESGPTRMRDAGGSPVLLPRTDTPPLAFDITPDGRSLAVVTATELLVNSPTGNHRRRLTGAPDAVIVTNEHVYTTDPAAGVVHRFRTATGLPEQSPALDFGGPGQAILDIHRTDSFVWFDDVHGPSAFAVHRGTAREILKYPRGPAPPPETLSPTPPPTIPPSPSTPTASPTTTRPPSPQPTPSKPSSPGPPSGPPGTPSTHTSPPTDPRLPCDGDETLLTVHNPQSTGPNPRIHVRVCVAAPGNTEYWILAISADGRWYAKRRINGTVSENTYTVDLLHGSGAPGNHRQFLIVAGRTGSARQWLHANRAADLAGDGDFPRDAPPAGIDEVSDRTATTS